MASLVAERRGTSSRNGCKVQAQVDNILARAGLQSSPFDPLSWQALHEYVAEQQLQQQADAAMTNDNALTSPPHPFLKQQVDSSIPPAPTVAAAAATREDRLMEQLSLQTSLILDLQRKIESLSGRVKELESVGVGTTSTTATTHPATETSSLRRRRGIPAVLPPEAPAPVPDDNDNTPNAAVPGQVRQGAAAAAVAPLRPAEPRLTRLIRVFGEMRRRQVPNFEWGLIFKVAIMMAILFSRLGGGSSSDGGSGGSSETPTKFYILGTVLVGGFLLQTGYAQFLYKFVVQDNIIYRILIRNENVVLPPPGPRPAPGRGGNNNNPEDGWFDWRETFLGGRIQRGEHAPRAPLLWRFIREVFLLVFAFVLSIFPMWHPEPPPPVPEQPPEEEEGEEEEAQQQEQRENAIAAQQGNGQRDNERGPGVVRPPLDPTEPEEDED